MEETNKQILLPGKKFWNAEDQDLSIKLDLDTSESLLRLGERDIVLDLAKLYDDERNQCTQYKIYGKLKMVFRNLYTGTTEYLHLQNDLYLNNDGSLTTDFPSGSMSYDEFAFLRRDVVREVVNPLSLSGNTTGSYSPTVTTTGYSGHTKITPIQAPYHNWNLYLSYVVSGDTNYQMSYTLTGDTQCNFVSGDGIPFRVTEDNVNYILTSPVPHGFNQGEYILLSGGTCTHSNYTGCTYYVNEVGNEVFNSKDYVLSIAKSQFQSGVTINGATIVLGKRVLDYSNILGSVSQYYVHKHKTITDSSGYIMDNVGFEKPIWEEERKLLFENVNGVENYLVTQNRMESVLFDFKEPVNISGLTNNLGYTPTEVYVTTILRNRNGYFNYPPKVGFKFNFHDTWIDKHFDVTDTNKPFEQGMTGNTYSFSPNVPQTGYSSFTGGTELQIGTILTGAFVEYNIKEVKERIISESYHKFTTPTHVFNYGQTGNVDGFTGATATNPFGYYYQPHHRVMLRQLSPYIEQANTNDIYNLPENTIYDPIENIWRYRDLYDHGFLDDQNYGTNFPFLNGQHYVMKDIDFYLRNEKYYINKQDGIIDFNDTLNKKLNPIC